VLVAEQPAVAAARIHAFLLAEPFQARGVHPSAVVGEGCTLPQAVTVGPLVCLGDRVVLGERVTIHPGAVIGSDTVIGDDTVIHANVTVADRCTIGRRVILHHGAVIGSDGFGFATDRMGVHYKKPQVGTVQIDDDVEIGANACVDRAAFGTTWIKSGARIDNLVMVGHNVVVGENSILVAQVGISGSTTLGRNVVLGGKVGVAGHLHLGDQVMAAAMSGIHSNLPNGASSAAPLLLRRRAGAGPPPLSAVCRIWSRKCAGCAKRWTGSAVCSNPRNTKRGKNDNTSV
jgi:UDP-3-O-[3-hydroxymyristoyl] glucosamine N-acyltransferase